MVISKESYSHKHGDRVGVVAHFPVAGICSPTDVVTTVDIIKCLKETKKAINWGEE